MCGDGKLGVFLDVMWAERAIIESRTAVTVELYLGGRGYVIFYNIMFRNGACICFGIFDNTSGFCRGFIVGRCFCIIYNIGYEFGGFDLFDIDNEVDAVKDGAGEFLAIMGNLVLGAATFVSGVVEIATGAGIHGSDEHEICGISDALVGSGDSDGFVFEGLAKGFENSALVFRKLVKEKDAVMGESDFAGGGMRSAADNRDMAGSVVRGAEWAVELWCGGVFKGVDFSNRNGFFGRWVWQEVCGNMSEESLAGSGRTR